MNIKRKVAVYQAKLRRKKRENLNKEIEKLRLQRNKNLKEADLALKKAQAQEDARDAQLTKAKAVGLTDKKQSTGKGFLSSLSSGISKLMTDTNKGNIRKKRKTVKRRTVKKATTTKRKTTTRRPVRKTTRKSSAKRKSGQTITIQVR